MKGRKMELSNKQQGELIEALGEILEFYTLDKVVAELIEWGIINASVGAEKVGA